MQIIDLNRQPKEEWRPGVLTQMYVSAVNGATQLCVFEQWCEPGHGAPTHLHAVEEILRVFEGQADVWIGETHVTLTPGQLVVPAGRKHGFANTGPPCCASNPPSPNRCSKPPTTTSAKRRECGCRGRS